VRKQYNFWQGDAWDVDRPVELSAALPVRDVGLATITEVDSPYWFDQAPTVRSIVEHVRLIQDVDMAYPIILAAEGRVMGGMHRIARALLEHRSTIKAVQFATTPEPHYRDCNLADLPYDEETST
jgi:hypothetical protein